MQTRNIKPSRRQSGAASSRPLDAPSSTTTIASRLAESPVARGDRVVDQVYRNLRRAIILGEFASGSRLREVEIAAALNVSRTPVREAISRLIGDRLVKALPTGGVEVADPSAELSEIYYIREALEGCAGRLAAKRITKAELFRLDELLECTRATNYADYEKRAVINDQFHMTIAQASGSRRLVEMIGDLREFFVNAGWLKRYDRESAQQAFQDHREIVSALRARSGDRVERLMRRHLKGAYSKLLSDEAHALADSEPPIKRFR